MTILVPLLESEEGPLADYDLRIGPLGFVSPLDAVSEQLGDGLDAVGSALTPAERRPRELKLKLPVRGATRDADPAEAGRRLRRQVRQLLENSRWRSHGLYFWWRPDTEVAGWLHIGGGDLTERDPGTVFGEYELELSDSYLVGRPGQHRAGRRLDLADRRTGLVPRDTRGTIYSTDHAAQALPAEPIVIPGDVVNFVRSGNAPVGSTTAGPLTYGGVRHLWRTVAGADGEVVSYLPDPALLPDATDAPLDLDDVGSVRVWDLSAATEYPPLPAGYTPERANAPDVYLGWERVYGDTLDAGAPLAIDNGACRLIWLGPDADEGLAFEQYDAAAHVYVRRGRILHATACRELNVVEVTYERAVIEIRGGEKALRIILQRGWHGPRLESYDDGGATARLEFAPDDSDRVIVTDQSPTWVQEIEGGDVLRTNLIGNPRAAVNTAGWTNAGLTTFTRVGAYGTPTPDGIATAFYGVGDANADHAWTEFAGVSGRVYTVSAYVRLGVMTATSLRLRILKPSAAIAVDSAAITTIGSWLRVTATFTADATGNFKAQLIQLGAGATDFVFTELLAEEAPAVASYFDGGYPLARWTGAAHASPSELLEADPVPIYWAQGTLDEVKDTTPGAIAGPAASYRRARTVVAQLGTTGIASPSALASLALVDAQSVPVLLGRP